MLFPIQFLFIAYFAGNALFQLFSQNQIFIFTTLSGFCYFFAVSIGKNLKWRVAILLCLMFGFGFAALNQPPVQLRQFGHHSVKADNQVSGPWVWQQFQKMSFAVRDYLLPFPQKALPQPYSQVLNSLIFGNSAAPLEREVQEKYRKAGVIHLLVVSGSLSPAPAHAQQDDSPPLALIPRTTENPLDLLRRSRRVRQLHVASEQLGS